MPVDVSSYGVAPASNPVDAFGRAFAQGQESQLRQQAIQQNARQEQEAQRKIQEDDAYKQAIASSAGMTSEQLLEHVRTAAPGQFLNVQKAVDEAKAKAATTAESVAKAREAAAQAAGHTQTYIAHLADQIDQSDYNPVVVNAALNMAVQEFPEWKPQADQLRQIAATQGKDALKTALKPLIDAGTSKTRAEIANTQAELPGKVATSAVQQQVAAGTVGGMTPEQQATNKVAVQNATTARGQLGVAQHRENRETQAAIDATGASAKELLPGSRDYRVAQDLASGDLTYSQFLRLYPSRSGVMAGVKASIYDKARDLNPDFTPAAFEAGYKFATNPKTVTAVAAVDNVLPNIKKLVDLSNSWDRTKYPDVNKFLGSVQAKLGDTTVSNIRQAQQLIGDELGTALGGGAMTDMKLKLGLDVVDPNLAPDVFMSNMKRVEEFLQNRKASLKTPMGHYGDQNTTKKDETTTTNQSTTGPESLEHRVWRVGGKTGPEPK